MEKRKFDKQITSCRYPCSGQNFAFQLLDRVTLVVVCGPFGGSQNLFIKSLSAFRERKERERQNTEKDREMGKEIEKEKPKEVVMEGRREGEEKEGR